ncbi:MAG: NADH-quinone oxidoreductase subunit A [Verrucomicrobia bacterium]|nr:NADH-quinone oxidoreductase subunit A [Verrucomicrobiota bacterium]MBI3870496.1 NADH-quinone oxidoreductase subunit A [Verrucomicrobiota bacterium]
MQLEEYVAVALLGLVAIGFAAGTLILSVIIGRWANKKIQARTRPIKDIPYECGMLPIGDGSSRLSVKFFLVAMLFILFDIEVVFLYPWAVVYKDLLATNPWMIFSSMISFLGVLFIGYVYAVKKNALDWKN